MRRPLSIALLSGLLFWCGSAASAGDAWHKDFEKARAEAQRLNRPLLVHFYADWCGPCRQMEKSVLHTDVVERQIEQSIVAVLVNVDKEKQLAARFGVEQLPSDVFVEPSGQRIMEGSGYKSSGEYANSVSRAAIRYRDLLAERAKPALPAVAAQGNAPIGRPSPDAPKPQLAAREEAKPMLDGYCAVTLSRSRKWEKGSPQFEVEHRGQTYVFVSADALKEFRENPDGYAPKFLGCDPVVVWETDRAVPGNTKFGAFYDDDLYLFQSNENRQAFKKNPDRYIRTRVVLDVRQIETAVR